MSGAPAAHADAGGHEEAHAEAHAAPHAEAGHGHAAGHEAPKAPRDLNKLLHKGVNAVTSLVKGTWNRITAVLGTGWDRVKTAPERTWNYVNAGRKNIDVKIGSGTIGKIMSFTFTKAMRVVATAGLIAFSPVALGGEAIHATAAELSALKTGKTQKTPVNGDAHSDAGHVAAAPAHH